jgi:charged multivesicular body protein 6
MGSSASSEDKSADSASQISAHDKAVYEVKVQRDRLQKYAAQLNKLIDQETTEAQRLLALGLKPRALQLLRRRKYQTNSLRLCEQQMLNLEQLVQSLEFAKIQERVFAALKQGSTALQSIQRMTSVDEVDALMSDTQEAVQQREEADQRLSQHLSSVDDQEIANELQLLEAQIMVHEQVASPPITLADLPEVPSHKIEALPPAAEPVSDSKQAALA